MVVFPLQNFLKGSMYSAAGFGLQLKRMGKYVGILEEIGHFSMGSISVGSA